MKIGSSPKREQMKRAIEAIIDSEADTPPPILAQTPTPATLLEHTENWRNNVSAMLVRAHDENPEFSRGSIARHFVRQVNYCLQGEDGFVGVGPSEAGSVTRRPDMLIPGSTLIENGDSRVLGPMPIKKPSEEDEHTPIMDPTVYWRDYVAKLEDGDDVSGIDIARIEAEYWETPTTSDVTNPVIPGTMPGTFVDATVIFKGTKSAFHIKRLPSDRPSAKK